MLQELGVLVQTIKQDGSKVIEELSLKLGLGALGIHELRLNLRILLLLEDALDQIILVIFWLQLLVSLQILKNLLGKVGLRMRNRPLGCESACSYSGCVELLLESLLLRGIFSLVQSLENQLQVLLLLTSLSLS